MTQSNFNFESATFARYDAGGTLFSRAIAYPDLYIDYYGDYSQADGMSAYWIAYFMGENPDEPPPLESGWAPYPDWELYRWYVNEEVHILTIDGTNLNPSTPADVLVALVQDTNYGAGLYHTESWIRLYLDGNLAYDYHQPKSASILPYPDFPKNPSGLLELKNQTFTNLKLEIMFRNTEGSQDVTRSEFGGLFVYPGTAPTPPSPVAGFIADPMNGPAPLEVSLTNTSTGTIY